MSEFFITMRSRFPESQWIRVGFSRSTYLRDDYTRMPYPRKVDSSNVS